MLGARHLSMCAVIEGSANQGYIYKGGFNDSKARLSSFNPFLDVKTRISASRHYATHDIDYFVGLQCTSESTISCPNSNTNVRLIRDSFFMTIQNDYTMDTEICDMFGSLSLKGWSGTPTLEDDLSQSLVVSCSR